MLLVRSVLAHLWLVVLLLLERNPGFSVSYSSERKLHGRTIFLVVLARELSVLLCPAPIECLTRRGAYLTWCCRGVLERMELQSFSLSVTVGSV